MCLRNNPWHWSVQETNFCVITLLNVPVGAAVLGNLQWSWVAWCVLDRSEVTGRKRQYLGTLPDHVGGHDFAVLFKVATQILYLNNLCSSHLPPIIDVTWCGNWDRRQPWVVMDCPTCSLLVVVVIKSAVNIVFLWNHNLCLLKELGWQPKIFAYFTCHCQRSPGGRKTDFVCLPHVALEVTTTPWDGEDSRGLHHRNIPLAFPLFEVLHLFRCLWSLSSAPAALNPSALAQSLTLTRDLWPPPHASDGIPLLSPPWITHSCSLLFSLLRKNRMLMSTTHQLSNLHEPEHPWKGSATE